MIFFLHTTTTATTATTSKKGQGPAAVPKNWGTAGYKLELSFIDLYQVEGKNSAQFSSMLGVIARCGSRLPLEYQTWRKVPKDKREAVWIEIKMNTNASDEFKENCLKKVGEIWKKWKAYAKKEYYIPIKDDLEALLISPERVRPEDWTKLIKS